MSTDETPYPCPVDECRSKGFSEKRNLLQHIRNSHGGKVELTKEQEEALGLTACTSCEQVFVTSRIDSHWKAEHGGDVEDFAGDGSESEGEDDTPPEGDPSEGAEADGGTRSHEYGPDDLFFGRLRPIRATKGEEAIVFAKMAEGILQFIFLAIQRGDENAESWATLAFNLCPKLLGNGNKGERIKLMSVQIEKMQKWTMVTFSMMATTFFLVFYIFSTIRYLSVTRLLRSKKIKNRQILPTATFLRPLSPVQHDADYSREPLKKRTKIVEMSQVIIFSRQRILQERSRSLWQKGCRG